MSKNLRHAKSNKSITYSRNVDEENFVTIDNQWERVNLFLMGTSLILLISATMQLTFYLWIHKAKDTTVEVKRPIKTESKTVGKIILIFKFHEILAYFKL